MSILPKVNKRPYPKPEHATWDDAWGPQEVGHLASDRISRCARGISHRDRQQKKKRKTNNRNKL
nr:uncharacterized protein CTRU02_10843 [Colletotrichum truncatum]KAF6786719.1 hypothetical protein CTRU02_10843 [Colletotrichum truncatum]